VIDGDSAGRRIYNELKRNFSHDNDENAKKKLLKIESNGGIENLFTANDFIDIVAPNIELDTTKLTNSERVKENAKAIIAAKFKIRVENGEVTKKQLSKETIESISNLLDSIEQLSN
jgi:ribosome maturation factor RimP